MLIVYWHVHIPVVVIADVLLTLGLAMSLKMGAFWESPLSKPWMAMLPLAYAAVFGIYPRESVPFMAQYQTLSRRAFYCCALLSSTKSVYVRRVLSWMVWGAFLLLFLCLPKYGQLRDGRLMIPIPIWPIPTTSDWAGLDDGRLAFWCSRCGAP